MGKKIIAIIICLCLTFAVVDQTAVETRASVSELIGVIGGSIAAGGLASGSIATLLPVAGVIVAVVLAGMGVYVTLTSESIEAGMTKTDFIQQKLQDYAIQNSIAPLALVSMIVQGAKVLKDGSIRLSQDASSAIKRFVNYLTANDQISLGGASASDYPYVQIGDVRVPTTDISYDAYSGEFLVGTLSSSGAYPGESVYVSIKSKSKETIENAKVALFKVSGSYALRVLSQDNMFVSLGSNQSVNISLRFRLSNGYSVESDAYLSHDSTGYLYTTVSYPSFGGSSITQYNPDMPVIDDVYNWLLSGNGQFVPIDAQPSADGLTSDLPDIDVNPLDVQGDDYTSVDPGIVGALPAIDYPGTIGVKDYIDALRDVIDGVRDIDLPVTDVDTGEVKSLDIPDIDNPVISLDKIVVDTSIPDDPDDVTDLADPDKAPDPAEAEQALQGMVFDLTAVFPFCIPFDLYRIIQKFDVEPEAPNWDISIPLPGVGDGTSTIDLDIDLSPFDSTAGIVRKMELLIFIIGLAISTRSIFLRS